MATTTNYGWTTPDDTSLVKDGAAAIRTLGSSVDTTTKALNPSTTLGDLEYRSATANTNTRLGIGSTGNVLTVTGGVPVWAAPAAAGGMTLIAATATNGVSSVNFTSIAGTYKHLLLVWDNVAAASPGQLEVRANSASTAYVVGILRVRNVSTVTGQLATSGGDFHDTAIDIGAAANTKNGGYLWIYDYASSTQTKPFQSDARGYSGNFSQEATYQVNGYWNNTTAISSIQFGHNSGNFANGGLVRLYGVS
jgi:hypothetical protein